MVAGARRAGLSLSDTDDPSLWLKRKYQVGSNLLSENALLMPEVREERPDWFEMIERQITTRSNKRMQKTISECTTPLRQMAYSSRRPHQGLFPSVKNRKLRHQFIKACLIVVADHVCPFMSTVYPSSDGYFQHDNASCHKTQIISNWLLEHDHEFTVLQWPPQSPEMW